MGFRPPPFEPPAALRRAAPWNQWIKAAEEAAASVGVPVVDPKPAVSGSDIVVDLGGFFFKMTAPRWADEIVAEARWCRFFAGRLAAAVPEVLGEGAFDGWGWTITRRVEGDSLASVWRGLDPGERRDVARSLGALVAEMQAIDPPDDGGWPAFKASMREGVLERQRAHKLDDAWLQRIEPFLGSVELRPWPLRVLHTELLDEHILVGRRDGRWAVTGLLDFADGRVGELGYEIPAAVEFIFQGEPGLLPAMLRAAGVTDFSGLGRELVAWGLLHQFGSVPRMLKACPEARSFDDLAARLYAV